MCFGRIRLGRMQPAGLKAFERRTDERSPIYSYERRKKAKLDPKAGEPPGDADPRLTGRALDPAAQPEAARFLNPGRDTQLSPTDPIVTRT